jgi:hypothetical protein
VEMLGVGNGGISHFRETARKSFPRQVLEMTKVQESGHFQMSNSISKKVSFANISGGSFRRCRLAPRVRADAFPAARGSSTSGGINACGIACR